jgi:hypothetical protein
MVQPGDFAVIDTGTPRSFLIDAGEWLAGGHGSEWDHAVIASRWDCGVLLIVEALPGGSREVPWHYEDRPHLWSTGHLEPCPEAGAQARSLVNIPYSWLDYVAIGLHRLHLNAPDLRKFMGDHHGLICSQLVDLAYQRAGRQLFDNGRWNGFVMPSDLGQLISASLLRPRKVPVFLSVAIVILAFAVLTAVVLVLTRNDGKGPQ